MKIRRRDSAAILDALKGGVVPPRGLQHIMIGRAKESKQILKDLQSVREGSSIVKFFIGDFGSGKSFIQGLVKQVAFQYDFIVTNADFTAEKRLNGVDRALPLYTELIHNLSSTTSPEGSALSIIIDKWITNIQMKVKEESNYDDLDFTNENFLQDVEKAITDEIIKMDGISGGYDFSRVLSIYLNGFIEGDIDKQRKALRWIRGEYGTRTEAKTDLGVRDIIDDHNYYNYLKVLSQFVRQVGYAGLVVNLDEAINLYKINHRLARERNYETILSMFNDCLQGNIEGLYITFSGTSEFLKDERRGLYSYGALRRRLEVNRYETDEFRDLSQPVIELTPLKQEELFVLLQRIRDIHAIHNKYEPNISDEEIKSFIYREFSLPGAEKFTTVGHIVKRFVDALNIIHLNPGFDRTEIFKKVSELESEESQEDIMQRFSST